MGEAVDIKKKNQKKNTAPRNEATEEIEGAAVVEGNTAAGKGRMLYFGSCCGTTLQLHRYVDRISWRTS